MWNTESDADESFRRKVIWGSAAVVVLGLLGAAAKLSPLRIFNLPATFYTTLIRGVPDLVLMLLIFAWAYGLRNSSAWRIPDRTRSST